MNLIAILEQEEIARLTGGQAKPEFAPGDTVIVSVNCLLYTSPSPRDQRGSRMPSSA